MVNWIRLEDRLPEDKQRILAWCPSDKTVDAFQWMLGDEILNLNSNNYPPKEWFYAYFTHWMPLLEPPEEE